MASAERTDALALADQWLERRAFGAVSREGVQKLARRLGLDCFIDDAEAETTGTVTVSISGKIILVDVLFDREVPRSVHVHVADAETHESRTNEALDLAMTGQLTKSRTLDGLAWYIARLARLDSLTAACKHDFFMSLDRLATALAEFHSEAPESFSERFGAPVTGSVGPALEYWQQYPGVALPEETRSVFRIVVGFAPGGPEDLRAKSLPPVAVSAWRALLQGDEVEQDTAAPGESPFTFAIDVEPPVYMPEALMQATGECQFADSTKDFLPGDRYDLAARAPLVNSDGGLLHKRVLHIDASARVYRIRVAESGHKDSAAQTNGTAASPSAAAHELLRVGRLYLGSISALESVAKSLRTSAMLQALWQSLNTNTPFTAADETLMNEQSVSLFASVELDTLPFRVHVDCLWHERPLTFRIDVAEGVRVHSIEQSPSRDHSVEQLTRMLDVRLQACYDIPLAIESFFQALSAKQ